MSAGRDLLAAAITGRSESAALARQPHPLVEMLAERLVTTGRLEVPARECEGFCPETGAELRSLITGRLRDRLRDPQEVLPQKLPPLPAPRVEVDLRPLLDSVAKLLEQSRAVPEETRGARGKYDWEQAGLEIQAMFMRDGRPPELKDVVSRYQLWFAARDQHPEKSQLYEHVRKLVDLLCKFQK